LGGQFFIYDSLKALVGATSPSLAASTTESSVITKVSVQNNV
jgi:hypothetical protein